MLNARVVGSGCLLTTVILLAGCQAEVGDVGPSATAGVPAGAGTGPSGGGASGNGGQSTVNPPAGGGVASTAGSGNTGGAAGGVVTNPTGGAAPLLECPTVKPGRAPLRRLTTNEYNNTVEDLLGDATKPGNEFPAEALGKGFANDADLQSVSDLLAEKYYSAAEAVANRATENSAALGKLHTCASNVTAAGEEACARSIIETLLPRAYRRPATAAEVDELLALYKSTRALAATQTFANGVSAVLTALLQSPDFLYRPEFGTAVASNPSVKALTGHELATRLSYLYWQRMPDPELRQAAESGALATREGVLAQARRLLESPKSHGMVEFFFDNLLPISGLVSLTRDKTLFPGFSATVGDAMRKETQRLLEFEIFENTTQVPGSPYAPGSWPAALTAPYTFVNETLFAFYGADTFAPNVTVTGTALTQVPLNQNQRLGLLTLGGMMAGTATTNLTNPVLRGGFVVKHLMCRDIPLPNFAVAPPEPYTGKTARERFTKHSEDAGCRGCHQFMDPVGFALENFDAVGRYRTTERAVIDGVTYDTPIDATGSVPGVDGTSTNPVEFVRLLASSQEMQSCFATNWMQFAYGRVLDAQDDCNKQTVNVAFQNANYNVKQLLLALTQTDAFHYVPAN
jgi:hypothetical protein